MSRGILTGAFTATVLIRPNFHSEKTEPWGAAVAEMNSGSRCGAVSCRGSLAMQRVSWWPFHGTRAENRHLWLLVSGSFHPAVGSGR